MNWQPIDTAPKDGTRIMVTKKGTVMISTAFWGEGTNYYKTRSMKKIFKWVGWPSHDEPTHWVPMPELPK